MGTSLRSHINHMCKDCIYDKKEPGSWRKQVSECAVKTCPLFEVRPHPIHVDANRVENLGRIVAIPLDTLPDGHISML